MASLDFERFSNMFKEKKPIIGVIHLKGDGDADVQERCKREIGDYLDGGLDGLIVEDYFGTYHQAEWALDYIRGQKFGVPYGVNCLNFDYLCFELATRYGCDFMQLDSVVGHVKPRDDEALDAFMRMCRADCSALLMGGVRFKYQPVLSERSLEEDLRIGMTRCDAVCVTGAGTGMETDLANIGEFRRIIGDFPLVICSGLNPQNAKAQLTIADGAVVGSFFKDTHKDTGDVKLGHVAELMSVVKKLRAEL